MSAPMIKGAAQERGGHGVIDDQWQTMSMGDLGPLSNVDHIARGVTDGLTEQGAGVLVDSRLNRVEVVVLGKAYIDALVWQGVGKQVVGAAINLIGTEMLLPVRQIVWSA